MNQRTSLKSISLISITSYIIISIIFLVVIILMIVRYNDHNTINENFKTLGNESPQLDQIEKTIQKLNETDNSFRYYTITYSPEYYNKYLEGIDWIRQSIDSLKESNSVKDSINPLEDTFNEKMLIEQNYIRLKKLTDSIKMVSSLINTEITKNIQLKQQDYSSFLQKENDIKLEIDTISSENTVQTKKTPGLIGKLFGKEETVETKQDIIIKGHASDSTANSNEQNANAKNSISQLVDYIKAEYDNYYTEKTNNYISTQEKLLENEKKLILTNLKLLNEVGKVLSTLEEKHVENLNYTKEKTREEIAASIQKLSLYSVGTFIIILILTFLILWYLKRISKAQERLRNARLKAVQDGVAKEKFLAYMSHEIRTPLFAISGFVEQLKLTSINKQQSSYLSIMQQSVNTLRYTVNDILDHSSLNQGTQKFVEQEFEITPVFEEVKLGFMNMFETKNIELELIVNDKDNCTLLGDVFRLKQVLNNLISNAFKYSEQGKVTIECDLEEKGDKATLKAKITDQGIGIPQEKLEDLFKDYMQLYDLKGNWRQGTGLGLAICKRLIELQGGSIWAESKLNEGSTFFVELDYKVVPKPIEETGDENVTINSKDLKNLRVLFVDDNRFNMILYKTMIADWNISFDFAIDGLEALEFFNKNDYDMVVTDIHMPKMNGYELTKEIRNDKNKIRANVPIIAITADVMQNDENYYKEKGITDYVVKPFTADQLYNILCKYSNKK